MRIIILLWLAFVCFSEVSCQKELSVDINDSSKVTPPGSSTGTFTAKIDGVPFKADKQAGIIRALNTIAITGQSNDGQLIFLRVADSGVHVYSLDIESSVNGGGYSKDNAIAYTSNSGSTSAESGGTLSITAIDTVKKTMSGTFSIKVFRPSDLTQKNITEGIFNNISYSTTAIPPANSADTFRVKVDGVQFPVFSALGISVFNLINLSASDQAVSKTVGLSFPSDITPGTYDFSVGSLNYIGQYNIGTSYLIAESGKLTILEHNTATKRIRGNFNFSAKELLGTKSATLTEGYFSIVYL